MASSHKKTFCLENYDTYGFDLDGCLAKYFYDILFQHAYGYLSKFLVEKRGYDSGLLDPARNHKHLVSRGLFLDKEKGNLLKIGTKGIILRCYHGSRKLSKADIEQTYGKTWDKYEEALNKVDHVHERYWLLENIFDLGQGALFARIVDMVDEKNGGKALDIYNIWPDVYLAIRDYYSNAEDNHENIFGNLPLRPEYFTRSCTEVVKSWLKKLKEGNKTVFLMTSSYFRFTHALCTHILGPDFDQYFDFYICHAQKPKFFFQEAPFRHEGEEVGSHIETFEKGRWYNEGNVKDCTRMISKFTKIDNPKVLYFGDGLKNDVFPSKHYGQWDTVFIAEIALIEGMSETNGIITVGERQFQHEAVSSEERDYAVCDNWGSFFSDTVEGVVVETYFTEVVRKYSDFAVPLIDLLAEMPISHKYETFSDSSPLAGYFPLPPCAITGCK